QQFFQFLAQNAGPDLQLVGQLLIDLTNDLPPLLEELQPLATGLLHVSDAAAKAGGALARLDPARGQADTSGGIMAFIKSILSINPAMQLAVTSTQKGTKALADHAYAAAVAAVQVKTLAGAVAGLTAAESKALTPLLNYSNAVLRQRDDAANLKTALQASG